MCKVTIRRPFELIQSKDELRIIIQGCAWPKLCQLKTSYSHLSGENLNWENASIILNCRQACRAFFLISDCCGCTWSTSRLEILCAMKEQVSKLQRVNHYVEFLHGLCISSCFGSHPIWASALASPLNFPRRCVGHCSSSHEETN